jgi:hypothetical protein
MEIKRESEIKDYIQEKEQLSWKTVTDLGVLKKEIKDWFLTIWLRNDAGLLTYADLAMKEEKLGFWESVKFKLLDLKLSVSCSYFSDFKDFLNRLKRWSCNSDINSSSTENQEISTGSTTKKETNTLDVKTTASSVESSGWIIKKACHVGVNIANNDTYRYILWGTGNKNKKWFDCQSFVRHCYIQAWINVPPSWWCGNMKKDFEKEWFDCITFDKNEKLKPWDILLDPKKHTEMCISETEIAWAHSRKPKNIWEEISVRNIKSSLSYRNPKYILRYKWDSA